MFRCAVPGLTRTTYPSCPVRTPAHSLAPLERTRGPRPCRERRSRHDSPVAPTRCELVRPPVLRAPAGREPSHGFGLEAAPLRSLLDRAAEEVTVRDASEREDAAAIAQSLFLERSRACRAPWACGARAVAPTVGYAAHWRCLLFRRVRQSARSRRPEQDPSPARGATMLMGLTGSAPGCAPLPRRRCAEPLRPRREPQAGRGPA
jgi:hypothetical protein